MPGGSGSSNVTSIVYKMCAWRLRRIHKGGKSKHQTRTYNMTVNHRWRILGSTKDHPGSLNDKTVALFDKFDKDIKRVHMLQDNAFELFEMRGNRIVWVKYREVWLMVVDITTGPSPSRPSIIQTSATKFAGRSGLSPCKKTWNAHSVS